MLRATWVLASLLSALGAQAGAAVVASRSLQAYWTPALQRGVQAAFDDYSEARDAAARGESVSPAWLEQVLAARHADALERGLLRAVFDDARVTLRGDRASVNAYLADLDAIAAPLSRAIEVTAYRLPLPPNGAPSSYSDQKSLQTRLMAGQPLWTARSTTRPGGAVVLGDARWTSSIRDVNAEVAQEAEAHDPKVDATFRGLRVALRVHVLPDEQLLMHGSWRFAAGEDVATVDTGEDQPNVESAERQTAYLTFAGKVRSGDGLLVAAREEGEAGVQVMLAVHARLVGPPPPPSGDLMVFPASAWRTTVDARFPLQAGPFATEDREDRPPVEQLPLLSPRDLAALLDSGDGRVSMHGATLVVDGDNAACARADALLRQLAEGQVHGAELRFTRSAASGRPRLEVVQPLLAGVPSHSFVGRATDLVVDFDVELAHDAVAADPVVAPTWDGAWSRALCDHRAGRWLVAGTWRQTTASPAREVELDGRDAMTLSLPDYVNKTWTWDGQMAASRAHSFEDGYAVELVTR